MLNQESWKAILLSVKANLTTRKIVGREEEHSIMTKGSTLQKFIAILNASALNNRASKYMMKLKGEIDIISNFCW
jgi:hypothetical protein